MNYYNDFDPFCCQWLRNLIDAELEGNKAMKSLPIFCESRKINEPQHSAGNTVAALTTPAVKERVMATDILRANLRGGKRKDRKSEIVAKMYAAYTEGASLSEVATLFGCSRQTVFGLFERRGLATRAKSFLAVTEFNGAKYTLRTNGYLGRTDGKRTLLHRDVWEATYGEIPRGFDIHHRDGNKFNNAIENLSCVSTSDHTRIHNPLRPLPLKVCQYCGKALERKVKKERTRSGLYETPFGFRKRKFCNYACSRLWYRGKPQGAKA